MAGELHDHIRSDAIGESEADEGLAACVSADEFVLGIDFVIAGAVAVASDVVNVGFADFDYVAFITVYKTKILPPKGRQEIFLSPRPLNGQGLRMAFACSVIPARLERATHSLEGCCSIQLSYGTNP